MSSLRQLTPATPHTITQALKELPRDLDETYVRILSSIHSSSVISAVRALKWLVVSKRTLYIEELADASSEGLQEFDQSPYDFREAALEPVHLVDMLRDLVEVQPALKDNVPPKRRCHKISLAHFSVQEFLLKDSTRESSASAFAFELNTAHISVARDCLAYLYRFNTPPRRLDSVKPRMLDFALREYAWYNWEKHVLPSTENESISDPARRKATILYGNFKSQSKWIEEDQSDIFTSWLPPNSKERLLRTLNIPWFYPDLGGYFETPAGPHEDPRWFGNRIPNAEAKEVALISILPSVDPEEDLRCQLNIVSLDDNPEFKAISYALGPVDDSPIYIGGSKKSVRPQLANILRNLRLHQEGQRPRVWADAISLEEWQSSSSSLKIERDKIYYTDTRLLVMLTEIFKEAQEVAISLGDEMPNDEQAIALIHKLVHLAGLARDIEARGGDLVDTGLYNEVTRLEDSGEWSILTSLLSRMWWRRRWTTQEMVLARSAVLFLGNIAFSFDVIDRFVEAEPLVRRCLDDIYGSFGHAYHEVFDSPGWDNVRTLSISRQEYNRSGPIDLAKLLLRFRLHTCMYREDVLRTIVPLTWESSYGIGFGVAYDETSVFRLDLPEAIVEACKDVISKPRGLDILSLHSAYSLIEARDEQEELPQTWFPALERDASEVQPLVLNMTDEDYPSLFTACGTEEYIHAFAESSGDEKDCYRCGRRPLAFGKFSRNVDLHLNHSRLSLKGAEVDTISCVSDAYTAGLRDKSILVSAQKLASMAAEWATSVPKTTSWYPVLHEAIWRTLLADQYQPGIRLPNQLPHHNLPSSLPPRNAKEVEEFLAVPATQKALKHLYGRKLFITVGGRIGLAPFEAQEGDSVVLFAGGRVPYVIRSTGKRLVGHFIDVPLWNFIGEW